MINKLPDFITTPASPAVNSNEKSHNLTFIDSTLKNTAGVIKSIYLQAGTSKGKNFLYDLNPYLKIISLLYILIINSFVHNIYALALISLFVFLFSLSGRINIISLYKKVFLLAFFFGFIVILPASLNIISPGKIIIHLISFEKARTFWIYHLPMDIGITDNGCMIVLILFLRVFNSVAFTLTICFNTSFELLIRSLKIFRIPDSFLMIITLAFKYILILSRTIEDTYFALKSRMIGHVSAVSMRRLVAERVFFIFKKSRNTYEQTYSAMISRGYEGKMILISNRHFSLADYLTLIVITAFGILVLII